MLHPVHRDKQLHHFWDGHRRLLRSGDRHVRPVLARLAGDGETSKRPVQSASRQEKRQPPIEFQVPCLALSKLNKRENINH